MMQRFAWTVCAVLGAAGIGFAAPATQPAASETLLAPHTDYDSVKAIVVSDDGNHVAFVGFRGTQQWVVLDGVVSPAYDWVIPHSLVISADGSRSAYIVQGATATIAVVDGKPQAPCFGISDNRVILSRHGKHFAYVVLGNGGRGASIIADGISGPTVDDIQAPMFSPDGRHLAYCATRGKQQMMVLDGQAQKAYDSIVPFSAVFSPDGKRLAYGAGLGGKELIVCDQTESPPADHLRLGPGFSPDGSRLAAVFENAGKSFAVIDGKPDRAYDGLLAGDFTFSPDSRHLAYAMKLGKKNLVIRDGVDQEQFDGVGNYTLHYSGDSRHLTYEAITGVKSSIVLDERKLDAFDGALIGTPIFSPDSSRLLFAAQHDGKWVIVLWDGHQRIEGGGFDSIASPDFSPDSRRFAYRALDNSKFFAVIDGTISPPLEALGPIVFGPDSKHVVYVGRRDGHPRLVIDGAELPQDYDARPSEEQPIFDGNDSLHMLILREGKIYRLQITLATVR